MESAQRNATSDRQESVPIGRPRAQRSSRFGPDPLSLVERAQLEEILDALKAVENDLIRREVTTYSFKDLQKLLGCGESWLYQMREAGHLRTRMYGRKRRVLHADLVAFLHSPAFRD